MKQKIKHLLKQRKAIMLAHNYQPPEIQELADLCGDSLELSIKASETDAEVIVFCGVLFMAETASILSPDKTVLLPRQDAGCPMADMVTPDGLKEKLGGLALMPVVTYVNSPASVKAMSTICCTSANVVAVVNSLDAEEIMMVPDRNLSRYAALQTGRRIHIWNGYCPVHDRLTVTDAVLSTSGMLRFPGRSKSRSFIVGTEIGLLYPLIKANPGVDFYPASAKMVCPDMKKITLEDVARSLEFMEGEVRVAEQTRRPALKAVKRMLDLS